MSRTPRVVVVGGGLAGLAAAIGCSDGGAAVTLIESRPRLGGATWSFERNGLMFDNGQHVYMRCCTAYRRFLDRVGSAEHAPLQDRLAIPVLRPDAGGGEPVTSWIKRSALPSPLHLGSSLLSYRHLPLADRLQLGRAALALRRLRTTDESLDDETFAHFLARHGQSVSAIERLWDLIALPTVNVRAREASLALAAKVFKTGLLEENDAADLGWSRVPLSELHAEPARAVLERAGATIRTKAKVSEILHGPASGQGAGRVTGVVVDGEVIEADAVVLAVPHEVAAKLLPSTGTVRVPASLAGLGRSPIVDVHIVYDRRVVHHEVAAAVDSPVQFVFDTTASSGMAPSDGQCVAVSISGADAEHGLRPEVLIDTYVGALGRLFPAARTARVVDAVVTREHAATFRGVPGTRALRVRPDSGVEGLLVAGAWTDTGWPATMEGAVRSGVAASAGALRAVGHMRGADEIETKPELAEEVVA